MASSSSSSSNDHNKRYQYDVFLSFSGEDTRRSFVDHLNDALQRHSIRTFKDDERLQKGKEIKDELLKSIEDSRFCIIIFSKKYAASSWCLDELVKIMECHKTADQTAFPVFYDVEPTEVRKRSGLVGEAFAKHTNKVVVWKPLTKTILKKPVARHTNKKMGKWRKALKDAANLCGWELKNTAQGHEAKVINLIVERVSLELRSINTGVDENLVGMEQRMQDLDPYLDIDADDVRMVGIKGMGGAGKTTLARAIFDKISFNFEAKSFVEDVRENTKAPLLRTKKLQDDRYSILHPLLRLKNLQEQVLRDVLGESINVSSVYQGTNLIKTRFRGKKILLVLDDVDHKDQLEALAGEPNWFKQGSRVIITTRDEQVLHAHRVKSICDVNLLSEEEAINLFRRHAFQEDTPTEEYEMQSLKVVHYAAGLPLTIKVLGSFLCGKNKPEWIDAIARLKTIPLEETLKKLELSYDSLEDDYKNIFLDVTCFHRYRYLEEVIKILDCCGFHARSGLRVLQQKSLITIDKQNQINMHDHIEEMGKNIVRREHPDEPDKHSRLWVQEEIKHVLANDLGSEATRCIELKTTTDIFLEGMGNMKKLRCLIVNSMYGVSDYFVKIDEARRYFPNSLQYLSWNKYPHWCLPKTFEANNLVELKMYDSKLKQLWEEGKVMKNLRFLSLGYSKLKRLDLGFAPKIKSLDLHHCRDLVELYVYGGCLKSLVYLNLSECTGLKSLSFVKLFESLEVLHLERSALWEFPEYITTGRSINSLQELKLSRNEDIEEIPSSIGNLHTLVSLHLSECRNLKSLPSSIGNLHKLVSLDLSFCRKLKSVPESIWSLQHLTTLNLRFTSIEELPEEIGQLECLEYLNLSGIKVKHLPGSICMLKHLKTLHLSYCYFLEKLPEDVGQLESLEILFLSYCPNLREIPNSICKLKCLKWLKLFRCSRLIKLPDEIGDLKLLQKLDVVMTGITQLPQGLSLLKGLKIYRSRFKVQVPDDDGFIQLCSKYDVKKRQIQGFQHLKTLDLRRCVIKEVPEALGQLECLEDLNLSYTNVKHLPDSICMLKHLKKLVLESCVLLEKLPDGVGQLESLEELSLSYTNVKHLPDSICMLKRMKKLIIQRCVLLEKLPDDVGQLESLEELNLSWCYSIREIPSSTCMLKQLKVLDFYHCFCLERLPEDVGELESLEELYITRCYNLIKIPSSIRMLQHLKKLELECCRRLQKLPDELEDYIFGILALGTSSGRDRYRTDTDPKNTETESSQKPIPMLIPNWHKSSSRVISH